MTRKKRGTRLDELEITSVDICDLGANQEAYMRIAKRDPEAEEEQELVRKVGSLFVELLKKASERDSEAEQEQEGKPSTEDEESPDGESGEDPDESPDASDEDDADKCGDKKKCDDKKKCSDKKKCGDKQRCGMQKSEDGDNGSDADHDKETGANPESTEKSVRKGMVNMIFDTTKMNADELRQYEDLAKRFGSDDQPGIAVEELKKREEAIEELTKQNKTLAETVQKMAETQLTSELTAVAKNYEILGKKAEDLVPVLRMMKKNGEEVYKAYIDSLDASKAAIEKSGVFAEIGKTGKNDESATPEQKIAKMAAEIAKSENVSMPEARKRAWERNPELVAEYESQW